MASGRPGDVEKTLLRLKTIFESLAQARQSQPAYRVILAIVLMQLGCHEQDRGADGPAVRWMKESIELLTAPARTHPGPAQAGMAADAAERLVKMLDGKDVPGALEVLAGAILRDRTPSETGPGLRRRVRLRFANCIRPGVITWSGRTSCRRRSGSGSPPSALRKVRNATGFSWNKLTPSATIPRSMSVSPTLRTSCPEARGMSRNITISAACMRSRLERGKRQGPPSRERETIVQRYIARALEHLHQAESQAYFLTKGNLENLRTNPELDATARTRGSRPC